MRALLISLACASTFGPAAAHACTCTAPSPILEPAPGSVDVPLDARIWLLSAVPSKEPVDPEALSVFAGAVRVPGSVSVVRATGRELFSWEPAGPLPAETELEVRLEDEPLGTFRTGRSVQSAEPREVRISECSACAVVPQHMGSCGDVAGVTLGVEPNSPIQLLFAGNDMPPERLGAATVLDLDTRGLLYLGSGACRNGLRVEPGARHAVRVALYDLAGRRVGASEPIEIRVPEMPPDGGTLADCVLPDPLNVPASRGEPEPQQGCGCGASGVPAAPFALLGLGLLRRRRA